MNTDLAQFDLHSLQVFHAVADSGNFTRASELLGLTQSAVTRQIQQLEQNVGAPLFRRTTRSVRLTEQGESFLVSTKRLVSEFEQSLNRFREEHLGQPPQVHLGLSHSIAHSHLPGLFAHFRRTHPETRIRVTYDSSERIREQLHDHQIDVAIFTKPPKSPSKLRLLHSFRDDFVIITPATSSEPASTALSESWLAIDHRTRTGSLLKRWMSEMNAKVEPIAELNDFDLIINLVALGLGNAIVPRRAVRLYGQRLPLKTFKPKKPLFRTIGVYSRKSATPQPTVDAFVESILFGWKSAVHEDPN